MKSIPADQEGPRLGRLGWALVVALAGAAAVLLEAAPVRAHAFGARYDLPLPLGLYLLGAGAAVVLSFAVMALLFPVRPGRAGGRFGGRSGGRSGGPRLDLLRVAPLRVLLHPVVLVLLQTASVGLFVLILAAGFLGGQDTVENIAPAFVWVVWWVGLAYLVALFGNLWPAVNPWSIVFAWLERALRRFGARADFGLTYPRWLGAWPAVILFGLFAWLELISETARLPATLATVILVYSGLTWAGMAAFGRAAWLAGGEAFSLAFGVLGRFAPLAAPLRDGPGGRPRHWHLRPYGADLVVATPCRLSMTVFVLVMLSTVTFDGFKETPAWGDLLGWLLGRPALGSALRAIHDLGFDVQMVLESVVLAACPLLFLAVFLGFCRLAGRAAGSARPVTEIAGLFVLSLVPIAVAYHLAHYLSYLLIAGQYIVPLASDPFGFGWNLFGTADYRIDIAIVGARFLWHSAVAAVVIGHVCAVGVAHFVALRAFETVRAALLSQLPFLLLMVAYTVTSLWILSQPIVGSPSLSTLRAPSATVTLAPFAFREICVDVTARNGFDYAFRSDQPVDFDIHYHEGLAIRFPVKRSGVTEEAARFAAPENRSYCLMWFNQGLAPVSLTYRVGS